MSSDKYALIRNIYSEAVYDAMINAENRDEINHINQYIDYSSVNPLFKKEDSEKYLYDILFKNSEDADEKSATYDDLDLIQNDDIYFILKNDPTKINHEIMCRTIYYRLTDKNKCNMTDDQMKTYEKFLEKNDFYSALYSRDNKKLAEYINDNAMHISESEYILIADYLKKNNEDVREICIALCLNQDSMIDNINIFLEFLCKDVNYEYVLLFEQLLGMENIYDHNNTGLLLNVIFLDSRRLAKKLFDFLPSKKLMNQIVLVGKYYRGAPRFCHISNEMIEMVYNVLIEMPEKYNNILNNNFLYNHPDIVSFFKKIINLNDHVELSDDIIATIIKYGDIELLKYVIYDMDQNFFSRNINYESVVCSRFRVPNNDDFKLEEKYIEFLTFFQGFEEFNLFKFMKEFIKYCSGTRKLKMMEQMIKSSSFRENTSFQENLNALLLINSSNIDLTRLLIELGAYPESNDDTFYCNVYSHVFDNRYNNFLEKEKLIEFDKFLRWNCDAQKIREHNHLAHMMASHTMDISIIKYFIEVYDIDPCEKDNDMQTILHSLTKQYRGKYKNEEYYHNLSCCLDYYINELGLNPFDKDKNGENMFHCMTNVCNFKFTIFLFVMYEKGYRDINKYIDVNDPIINNVVRILNKCN